MKKLKLTQEEKTRFLEALSDKLDRSFRAKGIEKLSIEDIKKEVMSVPKGVKLPKIYITAEAYVKMMELVRQSPIEISWHGLVKRDIETNTYIIYDVLIFPQINSATTTTADEEGFAKWQMNLISDMDFPLEDLRMHGHSHVNMNVFSSGVDDQYQEDLLHKVQDGDYYIFLIFNKKSEICALLYDYNQNILFETKDIFLDILGNSNNELCTWASYAIQENCKEATKVLPKNSKYTQSAYYGNWDDYFDGEDWDVPLVGKKKKNVFGGKKHGSK